MRKRGSKKFISYLKKLIELDAVADWIKHHHL